MKVIDWLDFPNYFTPLGNPKITVKWLVDTLIVLVAAIIFLVAPVWFGIQGLTRYFCQTRNYDAIVALDTLIGLGYTRSGHLGYVGKFETPADQCLRLIPTH